MRPIRISFPLAAAILGAAPAPSQTLPTTPSPPRNIAIKNARIVLDLLQRTPTRDLHLGFFLRWLSYDPLRSNLRFRRLVEESAPGRTAKLP